MTLRFVYQGLGLAALFVLLAGAASAQAPPVDTAYVDETVESSTYFVETNTSQALAFLTRVTGMTFGAILEHNEAATEATDTIADAATTATSAVSTAVAEQNVPALQLALSEFSTSVNGAVATFQEATAAATNAFAQETNAEMQLYAATQRDDSFDFAAVQRSALAGFGTEGVTVVTTTSDLLAAIAFDTSVESSAIVFQTTSGTFFVVNDIATGNVFATMLTASETASLGLDSLGDFRTNRLLQAGQASQDVQEDSAGTIGELMVLFNTNRASATGTLLAAAQGAPGTLTSADAFATTARSSAGDLAGEAGACVEETCVPGFLAALATAGAEFNARCDQARDLSSGGAGEIFARVSQA